MGRGRHLGVWAMLLAASLAIDAANPPLVLLCAAATPDLFRAAIMPVARQVDLASMIVRYITFILFAVWLYLAGKDAEDRAGGPLAYSPASRIWWYAVPVASVFQPYLAMRELYDASSDHPDEEGRHLLLYLWWGFWLVANGLSGARLATRDDPGTSRMFLQMHAVVGILLGACAIMLVRAITRGQRGQGNLAVAQVFA